MTAPRQLTREDLQHMTSAEIKKATDAGRCNVIMGARAPIDPDAPQLPDHESGTPEEWAAALKGLSEEQFEEAKVNGRLPDWLLADLEPEPVLGADQGARGQRTGTPLEQLLAGKTPAEIARMTREGRFDQYLKGEGPTR